MKMMPMIRNLHDVLDTMHNYITEVVLQSQYMKYIDYHLIINHKLHNIIEVRSLSLHNMIKSLPSFEIKLFTLHRTL